MTIDYVMSLLLCYIRQHIRHSVGCRVVIRSPCDAQMALTAQITQLLVKSDYRQIHVCYSVGHTGVLYLTVNRAYCDGYL